MSSYQVIPKTGADGIRRIWVWWNPCRGRRGRQVSPELVEGSPFFSPLEVVDAMDADRRRRAQRRTRP